MKSALFGAAALAAMLAADLAAAQERPLGSYVARLSSKDHETPKGAPLRDAAQIMLQDRVNVHEQIHLDKEDEVDDWFTSHSKRIRLVHMLKRSGAMSQRTRRIILRSTPVVEVQVYRTKVRVRIVDLTELR